MKDNQKNRQVSRNKIGGEGGMSPAARQAKKYDVPYKIVTSTKGAQHGEVFAKGTWMPAEEWYSRRPGRGKATQPKMSLSPQQGGVRRGLSLSKVGVPSPVGGTGLFYVPTQKRKRKKKRR